jgi:hypothetical protein
MPKSMYGRSKGNSMKSGSDKGGYGNNAPYKSSNYADSFNLESPNSGKPIGDKGMKAGGNRRTRQVADRYK